MEFVKKTAKVTRGKITDSDAEVVCQAFRKNNIHGSSMIEIGDSSFLMLVYAESCKQQQQEKSRMKKLHLKLLYSSWVDQ